MKTQLKVLLLIALMGIVFLGCRKEDTKVVIRQVSLTVNKNATERGTFVATGALKTVGKFVMDVQFVGTDSFYCNNHLIAPEGTFTTDMRCSGTTMTGTWKIIGGTGKYAQLQGGGTLVMMYPPDVVGIEVLSGHVIF